MLSTTRSGPASAGNRRVRYFSWVNYYYLGGLAIGLVRDLTARSARLGDPDYAEFASLGAQAREDVSHPLRTLRRLLRPR